MELSKQAIAAIDKAHSFVCYWDDTGEAGGVYFIVAVNRPYETAQEYVESVNGGVVLTQADGSRWEQPSAAQAQQPVLERREGMQASDFLAGKVTKGPYASDQDAALTDWLLGLSGQIVALLSDDDLMALEHGFSIQRKLGLNVSFTETTVNEADWPQQLRNAMRGDKSVPLMRENTRASITWR